MSRKIILIKQELLLLVYELNRSGLLAENEKIRPILAQLEKLLLCLHFMRTLPTGSVDPNFGRRVRNRRQLNSLQNTWPYGYSMPIAVRYTQDAFSRSGWLWPVDAKGEPLKATSYMAVGFYVAKYVNKKSDMDL